MKKISRRLVGLVCICGAVVVFPAFRAPGEEVEPVEKGWYLDSGVGVNFLADDQANPGFRVNVAGGYNFNRWVGLEGELGFLYNTFKSGSFREYIGQVPLTLNCVVRYENKSGWVPFGGIGLGVSAMFDDDDGMVDPTVFQLKLGVRRQLSEKMSVGLAYRFLGSGVSEMVNDIFDDEADRNHSVTIEFCWKF